jgi:hypothetical protein
MVRPQQLAGMEPLCMLYRTEITGQVFEPAAFNQTASLISLKLALTILLIQFIPNLLPHLFLATYDRGKGIKACVLF